MVDQDEDLLILESPRHSKRPKLVTENADSTNCKSVLNDNDNDADDDGNEEEEASSCLICFETWTSSGKHRIVSLKCGHLFGRSCIEKWLSHAGSNNNKCPQCNAPAKKADIRVLFVAKRIAALDDSGREEQLVKQVEEEKRNKRVALEREASLAQQLQLARAEIIRLKEEIAQYKLEKIMDTKSTDSNRFKYYKQITVCSYQMEECRCMFIDEHYRVAVVSRSSTATTAGSCHLVRISLDNVSSGCAVLKDSVHQRGVKGIAGSFFKDGLIGSVALDNRLKLTSLQSGHVVAEWGLPAPGWSIAFDRLDRNIVYVGLGNRRLSIFDLRTIGAPLKEAVLVDSGSPPLPVHSLFMSCVGEEGRVLVGATMNGVFLSDAYPSVGSLVSPVIKTCDLKVRGACSGLACSPDGLYYLAMFRQPEPTQPALLVLFMVVVEDDTVSLKEIVRLSSSSGCTRLSSPCLFYDRHPREQILSAAVIDESTSAIHLWDIAVSTGSCTLRDTLNCNTARPLSSVCSCAVGSNSVFIAGLSDQQLFLYNKT